MKTSAAAKRSPVLQLLRELLAEGRADEVLAVVSQLLQRNEELEQRAAGGHQREGVSSEQLRLVLAALPASNDDADRALREAAGVDEAAAQEQKVLKPRHGRAPLPANLRRIENVIRVPDEQRPCPRCGAERACIGHDYSEVVELIPAEVVVRRDAREKLACASCEGELVRAPLGPKLVAGGRIGISVAAQVLVDKYRDGLPLHRQVERFGRLGWEVAVQTLCDQVKWSTDHLRPIWRALITDVLAAEVLQLDATGIVVLDPAEPSGKRSGSLWGYVGRDEGALCAAYLYASTAKAKAQKEGERGPYEMLELRRGYTVADASSVFDASFLREGHLECGCNMHARRYFIKALDAGDGRAALPLAAYKRLYEIEAELKSCGDLARTRARQARSKPLYEQLGVWIRAKLPYEPPSSPLGRAMKYMLNHQVALTRFLEDGVVPIDNGAVERLHVRTALTRKNFLFAGNDAGAERAAVAYSVIGSCVLAGVEPVKYVKDVLTLLAGKVRGVDMPALVPAKWKRAGA